MNPAVTLELHVLSGGGERPISTNNLFQDDTEPVNVSLLCWSIWLLGTQELRGNVQGFWFVEQYDIMNPGSAECILGNMHYSCISIISWHWYVSVNWHYF